MLMAAALAAPAFSAFAAGETPAQPAKPDLAKGEASYAAVCAACHAADGNSTIAVNPSLAQQHPAYLVKQLQGADLFPGLRAMQITLTGSADYVAQGLDALEPKKRSQAVLSNSLEVNDGN